MSRIKIEERGIKAVFLNSERRPYVKIRVDGCLVTNSTSADWVVRQMDVGDLIVELKGRDVEHAVKQVFSTALFWKNENHICKKMGALIVSTQYPKNNTATRRAQEEFFKKYRYPLHVVSRNYQGRIENAFSPSGPFGN